jgi:hypothetical protein
MGIKTAEVLGLFVFSDISILNFLSMLSGFAVAVNRCY